MAQVDAPPDILETTASAVRLIRILRDQLPRLSGRYHIKSLGLFGSYVRNEQKPASDVDLLVEFDDTPSLFEFVRLEQELSALLSAKVDLVMKDALKPAIGKRILREVVAV